MQVISRAFVPPCNPARSIRPGPFEDRVSPARDGVRTDRRIRSAALGPDTRGQRIGTLATSSPNCSVRCGADDAPAGSPRILSANCTPTSAHPFQPIAWKTALGRGGQPPHSEGAPRMIDAQFRCKPMDAPRDHRSVSTRNSSRDPNHPDPVEPACRPRPPEPHRRGSD